MPKLNTILLTSFGGFPGARINPTQAVAVLAARHAARRLQRLGARLVHAHLPVVFSQIEAELTALRLRHQPQAVLHLGIAASRNEITPEARALNRVTLRHADAAGRYAALRDVRRGGPGAMRATLPAAHFTRILRASGVPACVSRSAGDYVCNQTLYLSLLRARQAGAGAARVGFIHLPRPRMGARPLRRVKTPRPAVRGMALAIGACLMHLAAGLRGV